MYILKELCLKKLKQVYFCSSCTVYGQADLKCLLLEDAPVKVGRISLLEYKANGWGKYIADTCKVTPSWNAYCIYVNFNTNGKPTPSGEIGELT